MIFIFRRIAHPGRHLHHRTLVDFAAIKHVRDRGFDHAVERENHLKPLIQLKNLIKSEPAKSLPLPVIFQHRDSLHIPIRPIEFIRKYPSVFEEFLPGGLGIHPHIKLTQQVIDLDAEEQLVYQSESYKKHVADRLVKLVMLSRIDKIPLEILDSIRWDLGLPDDYVKTIVPEFPDYFRVVGNKNSLELVCWSDELAVSLMEKRAKSGGKVYEKGMPLSFQMKFSEGFEMDKKVNNWFQEWQKLPYISPYENATHLGSNTDDADKWAVGVLHELLNLFVSKKAEKEVLLSVGGEWLGIRSWFKRAFIQHPGIFYVSGKMGTHTVVLKEGYKRGWLVEKNELVDIRNRYMHLMHLVNEDRKDTAPAGSKKEQKKTTKQPELKDSTEENDGANPKESQLDDDSDDEVAYDDDDDDDDEDDEEEGDDDDNEIKSKKHERGNRNAEIGKRRAGNTRNLDMRGPSRGPRTERSADRPYKKRMDFSAEDSRRIDTPRNSYVRGTSRGPRREASADRPYRKSTENSPDGYRQTETQRNTEMRGSSRGPRREASADRPYRKSTENSPDGYRQTETQRNTEMRGSSRGPRREAYVDRPYRKTTDDRADGSRRTETRRSYDSRGPSRGPTRGGSDDKPFSRNRASKAHEGDSQITGTHTRSNFRETGGERTASPRNLKKSFADKRAA
ncbi:Protein WHAT'S THIS FACTOR 9, mitochondrial [Linum grandiflorum]